MRDEGPAARRVELVGGSRPCRPSVRHGRRPHHPRLAPLKRRLLVYPWTIEGATFGRSAVLQSGQSMLGIPADALPRGCRAGGLEQSIPVWSWRSPGHGGPPRERPYALASLSPRRSRSDRAGGVLHAASRRPGGCHGALREEEDSIQALHAEQADRPDRARATPAAVPPYLFVVRSDKPGTFSSLRKLAWTRPDLLGVVFDRRWMGEHAAKASRSARADDAPSACGQNRSGAGLGVASCSSRPLRPRDLLRRRA